MNVWTHKSTLLTFSMRRSHPRTWNTLQLGNTTGNSSTVQDREPRFYKATRDLVSALTTLRESWWHNDEGSAFHEILEAFHTGHWKWRHPKSLMLSFGQNVHKFTLFCWILPIFLHKLTSFSPQIMLCACTLTHGCNHRSCYVITLLLLSLSALSIWMTIFKCFGKAYFNSFRNTETIQQKDRSLVPLCSMCHRQNGTRGATHCTNGEDTHVPQCQIHYAVD